MSIVGSATSNVVEYHWKKRRRAAFSPANVEGCTADVIRSLFSFEVLNDSRSTSSFCSVRPIRWS